MILLSVVVLGIMIVAAVMIFWSLRNDYTSGMYVGVVMILSCLVVAVYAYDTGSVDVNDIPYCVDESK